LTVFPQFYPDDQIFAIVKWTTEQDDIFVFDDLQVCGEGCRFRLGIRGDSGRERARSCLRPKSSGAKCQKNRQCQYSDLLHFLAPDVTFSFLGVHVSDMISAIQLPFFMVARKQDLQK
jgi:hypothetical protein